jgi:carbonic anhydrase
MSIIDCANATAPINISQKDVQGPCSLLCDYNHDYGEYVPNVLNKGSYLSLNFAGNLNPVKYNDLKYRVSEIRLYQPSLHKYDGVNAAGEILIIHGGNGKNLIVSVPIISGASSTKATTQLTELIVEASNRIPNDGESMTYSGGNFSLDNFITNRNPFYSYNGTLLYDPCGGKYAYVVYGIVNGVNISTNTLTKFQQIIQNTSVTTTISKKNYLFYNKDGANANENKSDEIYIDCQPVNEYGEVLVNSSGEVANSSDFSGEIDMDKIKPFLYVFAAIVVAYGISKGVKILFNKLKKE